MIKSWYGQIDTKENSSLLYDGTSDTKIDRK